MFPRLPYNQKMIFFSSFYIYSSKKDSTYLLGINVMDNVEIWSYWENPLLCNQHGYPQRENLLPGQRICRGGTINSQSRTKVTFHRPLILCSSEGIVLHIKERKKNGSNWNIFEVGRGKKKHLFLSEANSLCVLSDYSSIKASCEVSMTLTRVHSMLIMLSLLNLI